MVGSTEQVIFFIQIRSHNQFIDKVVKLKTIQLNQATYSIQIVDASQGPTRNINCRTVQITCRQQSYNATTAYMSVIHSYLLVDNGVFINA